MRFGLSTSPQLTSWAWLSEVWKRADQEEIFESAWTFDHFYPLTGQHDGFCLDGWMSLTALLHETTRIRGGVLVSCMAYRHPANLAKMAATLDISSGGRLELGIGAGWYEPEAEAFGVELGSLGQRFDRLEEGLIIVSGLLAGERVSFAGEHYEIKEGLCRPRPVQAKIPICIGGRGRTRALPLVARFADHWNFPGTDVVEFAECRQVLHNECRAIGRDPEEIVCSVELRSTDTHLLQRDTIAFRKAGADLGLVELPKHLPPTIVDDLAIVCSELSS